MRLIHARAADTRRSATTMEFRVLSLGWGARGRNLDTRELARGWLPRRPLALRRTIRIRGGSVLHYTRRKTILMSAR